MRMSKAVGRFTLQEFVAAMMPESWARYRSASDIAPMKPWQKSKTIPEALAEHWLPNIKEANSNAKLTYHAIVGELKNLLPHYEVVADDASYLYLGRYPEAVEVFGTRWEAGLGLDWQNMRLSGSTHSSSAVHILSPKVCNRFGT
jgi:hypothetical protein